MIKTFRFRIYPTKRQEQILNQQLAVCCELYNAALQERRDAWRLNRKSISRFDQIYQLPEIRKDRPDVAAVYSHVLMDVITRADKAFQGFFGRAQSQSGQRAGYPRFRPANRYDSLTYDGHAATTALRGKLRLSKIGMVRINLHRPVVGAIKTLTVKREAGRWFALFAVEPDANPLPFSPNTVGVDVGLTSFATLSSGSSIQNPRWCHKAQAKLRRLQRRVARRKKGSNRRRKAGLLVARFHNHIRDQRRDFHHKESRKIVNANGLIAVEDLNIKGLARSRLSKSIHDVGWSNFLFMLAYKAEEAGRVFVKVDPRGTSQTCLCGAEVRKTLAVREHVCTSCGLVGDRDHISAQIILARSLPSGVNVGDLMPCVA